MTRLLVSFLALILLISAPLLAYPKTPSKDSKPEAATKNLATLILSGNYSQALELIKTWKGKKPKGAWQNRLQFLTALLYLKMGNAEQAVKLLKDLQKSYPLMEDYVQFYLGVALRQAGKPAEAIPLLKNLRNKAPTPTFKNKVDRELAISFCQAGDRASGVDLLNEKIQMESSQTLTYQWKFDRARCLLELGDREEASLQFKSLFMTYPEGHLTPQIRAELEKLNPDSRLLPSEYLQRAALLLAKNRPDLAVFDLEAAAQGYGTVPMGLQRQLAETYFKARKYREAAQAFEALRNSSGFGVEDLEKLAKSYSRSDQFDAAIRVYEELLNRNAANSSAYLYKIAFLTMDKGDYPAALQRFQNLLAEFPQHRSRDQMQWYIAWCHYLLGDEDAALRELERLQAEHGQSKLAKRVPYWRARLYERQGQGKLAKELYETIARGEPRSYYAFLSLKRLEGNLEPSLPPRNYWAKEIPQLSLPRTLSLVSTKRLQELLLVGLWDDFLSELDRATAGESPPALADLRQKLQYGEASAVFDADGSLEKSYPAAYPTLVSLFSETRNLPSALAWAIMREESHFRPSVVSPANAIGLMQIIPPTGYEIAQSLGRYQFTAEDLYRPAVNIEFGVQYLAMNLNRFNGNFVGTIASYNAGPEAVERWTKARPNREWDEFVEEIPYDETNNYVKKVLKSYYLYSLLYR